MAHTHKGYDMDTVTENETLTLRVLSIDAWRDGDGWTWNNWHHVGRMTITTISSSLRRVRWNRCLPLSMATSSNTHTQGHTHHGTYTYSIAA